MRDFIAGSIGTGVPELRKTLDKYRDMSDKEKDILTAAILKNLNIPQYAGAKAK